MAKETASAATARRSVKKSNVLGALLRGLLAAVAVTVLGVVVSALAIKWLSPSETVISVMNQALKLAAVFAGTRAAVRSGGSGLLDRRAVSDGAGSHHSPALPAGLQDGRGSASTAHRHYGAGRDAAQHSRGTGRGRSFRGLPFRKRADLHSGRNGARTGHRHTEPAGGRDHFHAPARGWLWRRQSVCGGHAFRHCGAHRRGADDS